MMWWWRSIAQVIVVVTRLLKYLFVGLGLW
jgi:hypothetical protein